LEKHLIKKAGSDMLLLRRAESAISAVHRKNNDATCGSFAAGSYSECEDFGFTEFYNKFYTDFFPKLRNQLGRGGVCTKLLCSLSEAHCAAILCFLPFRQKLQFAFVKKAFISVLDLPSVWDPLSIDYATCEGLFLAWRDNRDRLPLGIDRLPLGISLIRELHIDLSNLASAPAPRQNVEFWETSQPSSSDEDVMKYRTPFTIVCDLLNHNLRSVTCLTVGNIRPQDFATSDFLYLRSGRLAQFGFVTVRTCPGPSETYELSAMMREKLPILTIDEAICENNRRRSTVDPYEPDAAAVVSISDLDARFLTEVDCIYKKSRTIFGFAPSGEVACFVSHARKVYGKSAP